MDRCCENCRNWKPKSNDILTRIGNAQRLFFANRNREAVSLYLGEDEIQALSAWSMEYGLGIKNHKPTRVFDLAVYEVKVKSHLVVA